jgi:hypothetical protein
MDKNTKILLGVGAVIAAYLILKPKKVVTSGVAVVPSEEKPQPKVTGGYACPDGTIDYNYTPNGVMSPCVGHNGRTPDTIPYIDPTKKWEKLKNKNCDCDQEPCNCGGYEAPIVKQDYDYLSPWA